MARPPAHKRAGKRAVKALGKMGSFACKSVFWVCCGPCVLCAICFIKPKSRRRGCVVHHVPVPPLRPTPPEPRLRPLTLPGIEIQGDQKTYDQSQSPFISKLPLELRRMIYHEMLAGVTVKLRTADGKPIAQRHRCDVHLKEPSYPRRVELEFGLTMLRTCRQIYSEAIEYLYTCNTFSLATWDDDYPTVDYLSYYFLPQRLSQVRYLRIHWEIDSFYFNHHHGITADQLQFAAWKKSWGALQTMTGLRKLHITLYFRWRDIIDCYEELWKAHEKELLEPVKTITAPADFVLVLPDRRCSTDIDTGDSTCSLQLPEERLVDLGEVTDEFPQIAF